ncbi:MAG: ribosome recycling factor [Candidatus Coatesbacteria bacterium]|nr:ribosome recycling factor [Candidatus Coatesbacteria bacterium]
MKDPEILVYDEKMQKALDSLHQSFGRLRSGKASINMLDGIKVSMYGDSIPINQVANIKTPDPKLIIINAWDKEAVPAIIKAIQKANIGLNPVQEGNNIKLPIPALTEEIRLSIVKEAKKLAEEARVIMRNVRRDAINDFKKQKKDGDLSEDEEKRYEKEMQDLHDNFMKEIDNLIYFKEKQIMEV